MKKHIFSILCGLLMISFSSTGQTVISDADVAEKNTVMGAKRGLVAPAGNILKEDKTDIIEVSGIGSSSFSVSNTFDGTTSSYKHNLKITVALLSVNTKENFQLIFYSEKEPVPYAANSETGSTNVYYPVSLYEVIRSKLDQNITNRKKIQLKVTQKKEGYREAILTL